MTTMMQIDRTVEKFQEQPIVDQAWAANDDCIIAILSRTSADGNIFQLLDLAKQTGMDGKMVIRNEHMHDGEKRDAIVFHETDTPDIEQSQRQTPTR